MRRYECRCICGTKRTVYARDLFHGHSQSCGCWRRDSTRQRATKHGQSHDYGPYRREYKIWCQMRQRCLNPNRKEFHLWGGRGITIYPAWDSFAEFINYIGPRPSPRHSLDRWPDPNGNYEPGNVRWATPEEQSSNTRRAKLITFQGETLCATHWARRVGLDVNTFAHRLKIGWSIEKALMTPPRHVGRHKA